MIVVISASAVIALVFVVGWFKAKSDRCEVCGYLNPGTNHQMKHILGAEVGK